MRSKLITIGDVQLHRFPEENFAPIEDCYAACEKAGLQVAPANYLARLRIQHPEKGSPAWTQICGATRTIVGTGLFESKPTIVVAHANHPLMTADAIRKF